MMPRARARSSRGRRASVAGARRDLVQQRLPDVGQRAVDQRDPGLAVPAEPIAELVASTRPPAPPPTTTMRCGAATAASARTAAGASGSGARSNTSASGSRAEVATARAIGTSPRSARSSLRLPTRSDATAPAIVHRCPWFGQRQDGATIVVSSTPAPSAEAVSTNVRAICPIISAYVAPQQCENAGSRSHTPAFAYDCAHLSPL